ncbi:MAG TPA: glutathione peroxidase [Saprospiraceae bacterium]|nr:glutathione peroxidase [Saprospiraceae bacterium]HMQ81363.1 glutathione peroxidase [Saprospiraceae bacterium]
MRSFYDFSAISLQGEDIPMSAYQGKVILVVNTASQCGLTPQYKGLQNLHEKYSDAGLVILGFPCNQFGRQEPGDSVEISEFCELNYGVTFQLFEKVAVNGAEAHPLFKFLKKKLGSFLGSRIKWNFTKFLIDANGKPFRRYAPTTTPEKLENDIELLLKNVKKGILQA